MRVVAKITSPVIYAAALLPIVFGPLYVTSLPGMDWIDYCCPEAVGILIFAVGTVALILLNTCLVLFEKLESPAILDHLRRCALLYAMLVALAYLLVTLFESQTRGGDTSGGYAGLAILFLIVAGSITIDALVLYAVRKSFFRFAFRGGER